MLRWHMGLQWHAAPVRISVTQVLRERITVASAPRVIVLQRNVCDAWQDTVLTVHSQGTASAGDSQT
jgi:hypothetical protein